MDTRQPNYVRRSTKYGTQSTEMTHIAFMLLQSGDSELLNIGRNLGITTHCYVGTAAHELFVSYSSFTCQKKAIRRYVDKFSGKLILGSTSGEYLKKSIFWNQTLQSSSLSCEIRHCDLYLLTCESIRNNFSVSIDSNSTCQPSDIITCKHTLRYYL